MSSVTLFSELLGFTFPFLFFGTIMAISVCLCECMENYFTNMCHFWQSLRMVKSSARKTRKPADNKAKDMSPFGSASPIIGANSGSQEKFHEDDDPPPSYFPQNSEQKES